MNTKKSLGNSKGKGGFFNVSIKKQWLLNIFMVLLSWITFPFLGVKNIKRFLPASLIVGVLEIIHASIGKKRKWWVFYNKPNSYLFDELPFNLGPFLFVTFWTLKISFGNFKLFILLNGIAHAFFAYPYSYIAKRIKYYSLVRFSNFQFFIYFFSKSFLLYGLQYFLETKTKIVKRLT
ncbi:hypothetical protein [Metabacillus niabensis]|uniref:hypothetical protein n=1 Tax=Metabacillus niabensis TaxID=324854 RepID=UPI00366E2B80